MGQSDSNNWALTEKKGKCSLLWAAGAAPEDDCSNKLGMSESCERTDRETEQDDRGTHPLQSPGVGL